MCLYITNGFRTNSGIIQCTLYSGSLAFRSRRNKGVLAVGIAIVGHGGSLDNGIDRVAIPYCIIKPAQHHGRYTITENCAIGTGIERAYPATFRQHAIQAGQITVPRATGH